MSQIIKRHGGTIEKFIGDEVMAVFGVPAAHEDDALRAVRAAKEMLVRLQTLNEEVQRAWGLSMEARIGINTGEVVAGDVEQGHAFVAGEPVIVAKRLEQAAEPGEVLIGRATFPLVEHAVTAGPLERIPIKGKRDDVGRRRVDEVDRDAPGVARRLNAPIVGREAELGLLRQAFERTVADSSCRLFTVLGPAGIGKSRLATELLSSVAGRARTAVGRCLSYGEGITFWPMRDVLRTIGNDDLGQALSEDDQRDAILGLVDGATGGSEAPGSNEEIFWAVRRAFEALARERPLVICLEDVHWAEPTLLDLIEYIVGWSRSAPILFVALARPELVEKRPTWIAPQPTFDSLALEPLSSENTESLLVGLGQDVDLPLEIRERIGAAAEGNPLFLEQMAAMAAEEDPGGAVRIPATIHALLAERLDRLTSEERAVIERAAVVGRDFPLAAVLGLASEDERPSLTRHLFALVRKGLIRPDPAPAAAEDRFSFHHVLVRDSAYEAMPKELRSALHERFADWLEQTESPSGLEELVGYHLEQAHIYRRDLAPFDAHTQELARRASVALAAAGARARGRNDVHAALSLLQRAVALRPEDDPAIDLRLDLSQALFLSGQFAAAGELADEAAEQAAAIGDDAAQFRARLVAARLAAQIPGEDGDKSGPSAHLLEVAEQARPVFAGVGDELALTEAWFATAWAHLIRCRFAAMLEAVEHALEHARLAGSTRWERELPVWRDSALLRADACREVLQWYEQEARNIRSRSRSRRRSRRCAGSSTGARDLASRGRGGGGARPDALARRRRDGDLGGRDARRRSSRRRSRCPGKLRVARGAWRHRLPLERIGPAGRVAPCSRAARGGRGVDANC